MAAAGNDGTSAYSYPASYDSVISVAAIDSNKAVADFSQYNSQVELAAPGVGVLSTLPYIDTNSLTVGGTTYSASYIENAGRGTASGQLVNGGLCGIAGAWSGKVVLCERGTYDFYYQGDSRTKWGWVTGCGYLQRSGELPGHIG